MKGKVPMKNTRHPILSALMVTAFALSASSAALASSYIHSTPTEQGYVAVPEHFRSDKTRAQVQAEAADFVRNGGHNAFQGNNYPPLPVAQSSGKTRQQVIDEYVNESPSQRQARLELTRG